MQPRHLVVDDRYANAVLAARNVTMSHCCSSSFVSGLRNVVLRALLND
jgi:hypothetical protein